MAERAGLPVFGRRGEGGRRAARSRRGAIALSMAALTSLALPAALPLRPLLVWNATASAPIGLYWVGSVRGVRVGDIVIARLPPRARLRAARRRYLPAGVPVVKRIAARGGARVCALGRRITIDGRAVALRLSRDSAHRRLPAWQGCHQLDNGQVFLLGDGPDSFDSRYFGPVPRAALIGRAMLLWPH